MRFIPLLGGQHYYVDRYDLKVVRTFIDEKIQNDHVYLRRSAASG